MPAELAVLLASRIRRPMMSDWLACGTGLPRWLAAVNPAETKTGPRTKTRARPLACAVSVVLPSLSVVTHASVPLETVVYAICMSERLLHGVPVSDEQIQAWADEAERGYDLADLPSPRSGRPPVGERTGVAVVVCLDEQTLRGSHGTHRPRGDHEPF